MLHPDPTRERPTDEHVLEVYRQACENARTYANSRFSNLSAFLTYVSLLTAGIAVLAASADKAEAIGGIIFAAWTVLGVMGLTISGLFYALEKRHHQWWEWFELRTVRTIEHEYLGISQYPVETPANRDFIGGTKFLGLGATDATYLIYRVSMAFFATAAAAGFALLVAHLG